MLSFIVPEILLLYASDEYEWHSYLSEEFSQMLDYPLTIHHKPIEHLDEDYQCFHEIIVKTNAVIIIISKDQRMHLSIGVTNDIFKVHWKNAFTLYFTLPEFMVTSNEHLEISLICGHRHLGTRSLKCLKLEDNQTISKNTVNKDIRKSSMKSYISDSAIDYHLKSKSNQMSYYEQLILKYNRRSPMNRSTSFDNSRRKVYFNSCDFYILPEINEYSEHMAYLTNTRSLDRKEDKRYVLYDIPRSASLSHINFHDRQVFV
ncbi:uncharacterized protein LOC128957968 [Oppia nitens]|uniref:uncharacterized protein LOC128957968 n=1 Tax=Oppia nitens TaxID=1686743 RepID=UPI0023DCA9F8|nr:uncharacterized protein LOC128957968 [Oppia nitens]